MNATLLQHQQLLQCAQSGSIFHSQPSTLQLPLTPSQIIQLAEPWLKKQRASLWHRVFSHGPIYFDLCELVCTAALQCHRMDMYDHWYAHLSSIFPSTSLRLRMLQGLRAECDLQFEKATHIYNEILKQDETHSGAAKRLVVVYRQSRRPREAIQALNAYLDVYQCDVEAWEELMDVYVKESMWDQAAYCAEECMQLRPLVYGYALVYAQVLVKQGQYGLAQKYFLKVLALSQGQVDALKGVLEVGLRVIM